MTQKMMRKRSRRCLRRVRDRLMAPGVAVVLLLGASTALADAMEPSASAADEPSRSVGTSVDSEAADASHASPKKRRASRKELDARLDALLAETLPADEYRETRSCLARSAYRKIEVLNEEYVLFSKGEEHWINKLRRRCPSLRFNDLPVFVQKGTTRLCESDPFYPTNSMDLNMTLTGGRAMGYQASAIWVTSSRSARSRPR
jgi:hypothetical protein